MRELRPGLWHWEAPHPQWRATEPWSENVSSYAIDDGERLLLFDPLAVPSDLVDIAAGRERRRSCSPRRGMSATRKAWSSGSGAELACPGPRCFKIYQAC